LVDWGFAGGGLGPGGGLLGDAPEGGRLGDGREGGRGLVAFEVGHGSGEGAEDAALVRAGVHAHGHKEAQRSVPAGRGHQLV
jgi:hypothetical protein